MYRVSLTHLDPKTVTPTLEIGITECGKLSEADLRALLVRFCQIDPAENARVEPEIRVEIKGDRYVFQTGAGKLHLYKARDRQAPAIVLTPGEALAQIGRPTPVPRREPIHLEVPLSDEHFVMTAEPTAATPGELDEFAYVPPPPPRPSRRVPVLVVIFVLLLGALGVLSYGDFKSAAVAGPAEQPLADTELAAVRRTIVGVYLTSSEPGGHGIAIADDGTAKFFRLNARLAPSVVFDTLTFARRGSSTVALVERLGTAIEMTGPDTLVYGGETFRRVP